MLFSLCSCCILGREFFNKEVSLVLNKHDTRLYSSHQSKKSSIVERAIRSFKSRLYKYLTHNKTKSYVNALQDITDGINRYAGRVTKMAPDLINETNEKEVLATLKKGWERDFEDPTTKTDILPVGTLVRLLIDRGTFYKSYKSQWTERVYRVTTVNYSSPITYQVVDNITNQPVDGNFYSPQLSILHDNNKI